MSTIAVRLEQITKRFPGVLANELVDLEVKTGEIHALLGENGAGKSTLMSVLCGLYRPDHGTISIQGPEGLRKVDIRSPRHAIELGIGMVHQHFKLVSTQSVAENVIIGMKGVPFRLDMRAVADQIRELGRRYHIPVEPDSAIWQLSVGEQQRVEILKVLHRGARILILDEPTAVLTPQESKDLAETMKAMVAEGKSIVFISHKLDEVMACADRVTVLRDGRNVATLPVAQTSKQELARLMVGRELAAGPVRREGVVGEPALELIDVSALNDRGLPALNHVTLSVGRGEIVGVAGVTGNGQRELAEVITGLRRPSGGSILLKHIDRSGYTPRRLIESGVCHVPGDRLGVGLAGNLSLADNLAMRSYRKRPLARGPFLDRKAMTDRAVRLIADFGVSVPGPHTVARNLSGGNQQKAILARELTAGREVEGGAVLVAAYPTRGLDVGAIESVRSQLLAERHRGTAVLLISEDLDELMVMSDRIAVLHGGEIMGVVSPAGTSIEELGLLMAGERSG